MRPNASRVCTCAHAHQRVVVAVTVAHCTQVRSECLNVFSRHYGGRMPLFARDLGEHNNSFWLRQSPYTEAIYGLFKGHV